MKNFICKKYQGSACPSSSVRIREPRKRFELKPFTNLSGESISLKLLHFWIVVDAPMVQDVVAELMCDGKVLHRPSDLLKHVKLGG